MIIINMLKLCDKSICKPLIIAFKSCLTKGTFPEREKQMSHQSSKKRQTVC